MTRPFPNIRIAFEALPQNIRDWLSGEEVTDTIIKINKRLEIDGIYLGTLAEIITLIVIQGLKPEKAQEELVNELDITPEESEKTVNEIYEKILKPIESELEKGGIVVKDIIKKNPQKERVMDIGSQKIEIKSTPIPSTPTIQPAPVVEKVIKPTLQPTLKEAGPTDIKRPIQINTPPPPQQFSPKVPQEHKEDEPFILHETKPLFTPETPPQKPSVNFDPRPTFRTSGDKKISVDVETPENKNQSGQKTRVVHYSDSAPSSKKE